MLKKDKQWYMDRLPNVKYPKKYNTCIWCCTHCLVTQDVYNTHGIWTIKKLS